jgi:hypothetical protein
VSKASIIIGVVLLVFAGICLLLSNRSSQPAQGGSESLPGAPNVSRSEILKSQGDSQSPAGPAKSGAASNENDRTVLKAPVTDSAVTHPPKIDEKHPPEAQHYGTVVPIPGNATPQAASVMEALKSRTQPERLSAMFQGKPFNKAEFDANPKAYLDVTEPGRVFETAQPGDGVPVLTAAGDRMVRIKQGESVRLSVKGVPLSPISFTSFDLGAFQESKLSSVTVQADKEGVAAVTFIATPGTLNDANVLAGSPLSSGQVKFVVDIAGAAGPLNVPRNK